MWRGLGLALCCPACGVALSLGSVLAAAAFSISFAVLHFGDWVVMLSGVAMGLLAVFMHRGNIVRLIKGEEQKTNLFKK